MVQKNKGEMEILKAEEKAVAAAVEAAEISAEFMPMMKGTSPAIYQEALQTLLVATKADEGNPSHPTLRKTAELMTAVVKANAGRNMMAYGILALGEMTDDGPERFAGRVERFHKRYTELTTIKAIGGDEALQKALHPMQLKDLRQ